MAERDADDIVVSPDWQNVTPYLIDSFHGLLNPCSKTRADIHLALTKPNQAFNVGRTFKLSILAELSDLLSDLLCLN